MKIKYRFMTIPCGYVKIKKDDIIFTCLHIYREDEIRLKCKESHVVYLETENGVPIVICQKCLEKIELEDVREEENKY